MPKYLKKRGNNWYVQYAVPRPLWEVVGTPKIIRTTGESDLRKAEARRFDIIQEIRQEIADKVDDDPASPSWLERQAIGIRKAVARGEIDDQMASDWIGVMRDKHLKANSKSEEDNLPPETISRSCNIDQQGYRPDLHTNLRVDRAVPR